MKQTDQPVVHIIILGFFLAGALLLFYLTQRQLMLFSKTQARVDNLRNNQIKLDNLDSNLPTYSVLGNSWLRTLPANEKDVAAFATAVEGLAKAQNLTIALGFDDFPGPVDVLGHYIAGLGSEITLEGNYAGVTSFLAGLSNLPYFFKIDKMTVMKPETKVGVRAVFIGALMMNQKL
ncbi:hypothetical protein A3A84_01960 [Candidatus Collierbacteria bacterium RIFCSPLOWO2_01_FULL_50_23]|uniref:Uncharacterized protein n=1 Tax=Candidatus Collierbacteria bacterium RIFCSPHIGHO2_01_FULL_50_25 TaxID=1817722 RepID=A0A1F5EYD5_9BACT|nr:MAG: hypothetical protein A2703_01595 [Candidatus Collierbacteria bacterium RIFCSPHIGHO2_01_FULL_50_25]OGD73732.1 MAG: hypothetical protein A3A84_01960 [Candidatus Collierbacteria bacterium RIFCSPLOWO2_01_FULL_50_23]